MPKQFENPEAERLENEIVSDTTEEKRIERVAQKAAEQASQTEKRYDSDHTIISH
jgi:hypothetical protein